MCKVTDCLSTPTPNLAQKEAAARQAGPSLTVAETARPPPRGWTGLDSDLESPSAVRRRLGVHAGLGSGVIASRQSGEGSRRPRRGGRGGVHPSAVPGGSAACAGWGGGALREPSGLHLRRGSAQGGQQLGARGRRAVGGPYLLGDRGAVGDEHERGEHVDGEAQEGDGVGGHPQRDPLEQPRPVELQRRLEQRDARRGVAVLLQPPQLRRAQRLGQRLQPARRRPGPGARRHGRLRAPPLGASAARAGLQGGDRWKEGLAGPGLRRPGGTRRSGPRPRSRSGRAAPGPGAPAPRAAGRRGRGLTGCAGRGRGRLVRGPAGATGPPRPPGHLLGLHRPSLFNWRTKGPDYPKIPMHLPLRSDSSPGTAGDAPGREVSPAGQLVAVPLTLTVCIARLSSLVNALVFSHTEGRRCLQTWGRRGTV